MTVNDTRRYAMLIRVKDFGNTHGHRFAEGRAAHDQFAVVTSTVAQLSAHAVATSATGLGKAPLEAARDLLLDWLEAISRTARALSDDTPGLGDTFHLPPLLNHQTLLTAGRRFASEAETFSSLFVTHGLPATFITDLQALVTQLEQAVRAREARKNRQTAARTNIRTSLRAGNTAVRKLDAVINNQLHGDTATLDLWRRAKRVLYTTRSKAAPAPPSPAPAEPGKGTEAQHA